MRRILFFGASKGLGLELAHSLNSRDDRVVAMVRPGSDATNLEQLRIEVIRGDASMADDISHAFAYVGEGATVISTLSGHDQHGQLIDDIANMLITDIARHNTVKRFLLVSAIGCGEMSRYRSAKAIAAFGKVVDAKTRAENYLRGSGVPYTLIRPGGLTNKPATGQGMLTTDWTVHGSISRADAAEQIFNALETPLTIDQAFALVDEDLAYYDRQETPEWATARV